MAIWSGRSEDRNVRSFVLIADINFSPRFIFSKATFTTTIGLLQQSLSAILIMSNRAPAIPSNVISVVLSFVQDRTTWNSVCSANKEFYEAGRGMTPPWPDTKFKLGPNGTTKSLKFSPCGSFLACGANSSSPYLLSICDRRGRLTRLICHTSSISDLSFSKNGKYLASVSASDTFIRIWPTNSTGLPQQSDKKLLGHWRRIQCFDFAPNHSNILVSVDSADIKVWNVETEGCTHRFYSGGGPNRYIGTIRSIYFPLPEIKITSASL
jgi:WD40 repeat protein